MFQKEIKINGKSTMVPFPNIGQIIDIESMKMALAGGSYDRLVKSNTKTALYSLDIIDAISYFSALIPEFRTKFKDVSWDKMNYKQGLELQIAFKEYQKWYYEVVKNMEEEVKQAQSELDAIVAQP